MADYPEWVIKRAGGRRRYNAQRQRAQAVRRHEVAALLFTGLNQSAIAAQLQVHKGTISRDVRAVIGLVSHEKCPYCKRWFINLWGRAAPQCHAIGRPKKKRKPFLFWA